MWAWITSWAFAWVFLGFAALAIYFPSGQLPDRGWRRPSIAALGIGLAALVLAAIQPTLQINVGDATEVIPNPFPVAAGLPIWQSLTPGLVPVAIAIFIFGVLGLVVRYRRAVDVPRLQMRWLLASIVFVLAGILFGVTAMVVSEDGLGGLQWIPVIIGYPTIPLAIAIAILRYRLYDIDWIVNRAVVYGVVTAILAGLFAVATSLSQRLFIEITGGGSDAVVILSTLAVATLYTPVRKRVEGTIDRYFKYDQRQFGPYRAELRKLVDLVDPLLASGRLAQEVLAETRAVGVAVVDRAGGIVATAGQWPAAGELIRVPITVTGSPIAEIQVGPRKDGRDHEQVRLDALAEVANLAALALSSSVIGRMAEPSADPVSATTP